MPPKYPLDPPESGQATTPDLVASAWFLIRDSAVNKLKPVPNGLPAPFDSGTSRNVSSKNMNPKHF